MKYYLSYDYIGGHNEFYVETEEEKDRALERIEDDPHVIQSSVKVETKEY